MIMRKALLLSALLIQFSILNLYAQDYNLRITMQDNSVKQWPVNNIASIHFEQIDAPTLEGLTGEWLLVAMPNGTNGEGNIHTATTDSISFEATLADDGLSLVCHADSFYTRSGNVYPADWRLLVEQDNQNGLRRIGLVLDAEHPASTSEFTEPKEKYLDNGFFYWGNETDAHHYIYLLSENINTQRLEGMTLWSGWKGDDDTPFILPQNQEIYGIVSADLPFSGSSLGYFEIWASPRFIKKP